MKMSVVEFNKKTKTNVPVRELSPEEIEVAKTELIEAHQQYVHCGMTEEEASQHVEFTVGMTFEVAALNGKPVPYAEMSKVAGGRWLNPQFWVTIEVTEM